MSLTTPLMMVGSRKWRSATYLCTRTTTTMTLILTSPWSSWPNLWSLMTTWLQPASLDQRMTSPTPSRQAETAFSQVKSSKTMSYTNKIIEGYIGGMNGWLSGWLFCQLNDLKSNFKPIPEFRSDYSMLYIMKIATVFFPSRLGFHQPRGWCVGTSLEARVCCSLEQRGVRSNIRPGMGYWQV